MKANKTEKIFRARFIKNPRKYTYIEGNFTYQVSTPYPSRDLIKTYDIACKEVRISLSTVELGPSYDLFLTYKIYNNLILFIRRHRQCSTFFNVIIV